MAANPINPPLPADLPENWQNGQIVAPEGADVGLSAQHGYNYLMQQVNAAQEGVNALGQAVEDLGGEIENLPTDGIMLSGGGGVSVMPADKEWVVTFGNGQFIAVGYDNSSRTSVVATSADGIAWISEKEDPFQAPFFARSICYGNGTFVAVGYYTDGSTPNNIAFYSADGIAWMQTPLPVTISCIKVIYANEKFVAVGNAATYALYSSDGINWTQAELPANGGWTGLAYGLDKFVAIDSSGALSAYSVDGITWMQGGTFPGGPSAGPERDWTKIEYGNGMFVAVSQSDNKAAYSTDGINWSATTLPEFNGNENGWGFPCYKNGLFIAFPIRASDMYTYSTDGINWAQGILPISFYPADSCYAKDRFVITPNGNRALFSTDGINWTSHLVDGNGADVTAQVRAALDMDAVDVSVPDDTAAALDIPAGSTVNDALLAVNDHVMDLSDALTEYTTTIQTIPYQSNVLTYTGSSQSPAWSGYDSSKMSMGGTTTAVNAGTYTATFTPISGYKWADGTTSAKSVNWTINKAAGSMSISPTSLSLTESTPSGTITVTRTGNGAVTASSSDTGIATVSVSGTTITVTGASNRNGSATITVRVAAGSNHTAPANRTCAVTVTMISVGKTWTFTSNATFTVPVSGQYEIELHGGGGGGGGGLRRSSTAYAGGGGGSGQRQTVTLSANERVAVTIGSGGTGGQMFDDSDDWGSAPAGEDGGSSSFGSYITVDGGKGGAGATRHNNNSTANGVPGDGAGNIGQPGNGRTGGSSGASIGSYGNGGNGGLGGSGITGQSGACIITFKG